MKITNQNVPPDMQQRYDALISSDTAGAGAGTRARTRRGARIRPGKQRTKTNYADITEAVKILFRRLGYKDTQGGFSALVRAEKKAIGKGIWNPTHWQKCPIITTDYLANIPASVQDMNPPPYAYRDPANMPTIPAYSDGTAAAAPARYTGATSAGLFSDTLLVWTRTTYRLLHNINPDLKEPLITAYQPTITVAANVRGSRAMLSVILRLFLGTDSSPALTTIANPVLAKPPGSPPETKGPNALFWRYVLPSTVPPYWNELKLRQVIGNFAPRATRQGAAPYTRAVALSCPRPLFGRGFNNNTAVSMQLSNAPSLYQIKKDFDFSFQPKIIQYSEDGQHSYEQPYGDNILISDSTVYLNSWAPSFNFDFTAKSQLYILGRSIVMHDMIRSSRNSTAIPAYSTLTNKGFYINSVINYNATTKIATWTEVHVDQTDIALAQQVEKDIYTCQLAANGTISKTKTSSFNANLDFQPYRNVYMAII